MAENNQAKEELESQLADRRAEAQAAMEDEKRKLARQEQASLIESRRGEAKRALEGEEWRKRRETKEQLAARRAAEREEASRREQAALEAELAATEEAEAKEGAQAEATQIEFDTRVDKIQTSRQNINQLKSQKVVMSPIRTLKTDLARVVKEEGMSISSIALSEQSRKRFGLGTEPEQNSKVKLLPYLLFLLGIIIVLGGLFFWWQGNRDDNTLPAPILPATQTAFIFAEETQNLPLLNDPGAMRESIRLAKETGEDWDIKHLIVTQGTGPAAWTRLAQSLGLNPPSTLAKTLTGEYMLGLYRKGSAGDAFILLKSSFPDQAFAGMMEWEQSLPLQIFPLFYDTLPKVSSYRFGDKLIRNKDSRFLATADGQILLLYSFIDRETIIIAPSEAVFNEVFNRFANDETL